jgi:hypothetical protein
MSGNQITAKEPGAIRDGLYLAGAEFNLCLGQKECGRPIDP